MSAVRLSFLQVTNSEVITAHSNAWHTRIAMSLHAHTHSHACTETHMTQIGRRTDVHSLTYTHAGCQWANAACSQRHLQHTVCTFTHVTQTHQLVCPHTHCLVDVQTPFLLSSQSHWRRHAYTHTHSNKTWWKVTRHVRTSYDSQPHLILFSLLIFFFVIDLSAELARVWEFISMLYFSPQLHVMV